MQSTHQITIPFVSQKVNDLLLWRDPKKSGIFFGVATLVFVTFMFMKMPLIAVICYSAGTLILLTTLWSRFGKTIGKPMPALPTYLSEGMSEVDYRGKCDKLKPSVDKALSTVHGLITSKDVALNAKAASGRTEQLLVLQLIAGLFLAGKILAYMSPISIAYLGIFAAFVAPKVYETYKDHIDEGIAHAKTQGVKGYDVAKGHLNQVVDKVPVLKNLRAGMAKKVE